MATGEAEETTTQGVVGKEKDVLTLQQAGDVLDVSTEFVRRRIKAKVLSARFDRGSKKLGYLIQRDEFVRYLRSIGEDALANEVERGILPQRSSQERTFVLN